MSLPRHRFHCPGTRAWAIPAILFIFVLCATLFFQQKQHGQSRLPDQFDPASSADTVKLTLLRNAEHRGAFCLDGSPPGYHFQKGFGSGSKNWILHIEGGGWCNTVASCMSRKSIALGSSRHMEPLIVFSGILSSDPSQNPDFFNWNKIMIRYCDGASFAGHPEREPKDGERIYFRGKLIWEALMDEFLSLGLYNAEKALLTGCSAGGLATLIHCDRFRESLPRDTTVKCLADAGFFLNVKDISGNFSLSSFYRDVVNLQAVEKSLSQECVEKKGPTKCFFAQEIIKYIKTPLFIVNPAYDIWQIQHSFVPPGSDPRGLWQKCRWSLQMCNPRQIDTLHGYRDSMLKALSEYKQTSGGIFINSCFAHCQTLMQVTWHSPTSPRIQNTTIAESVANWFFDLGDAQLIDCPYPCNPTCVNLRFD